MEDNTINVKPEQTGMGRPSMSENVTLELMFDALNETGHMTNSAERQLRAINEHLDGNYAEPNKMSGDDELKGKDKEGLLVSMYNELTRIMATQREINNEIERLRSNVGSNIDA